MAAVALVACTKGPSPDLETSAAGAGNGAVPIAIGIQRPIDPESPSADGFPADAACGIASGSDVAPLGPACEPPGRASACEACRNCPIGFVRTAGGACRPYDCEALGRGQPGAAAALTADCREPQGRCAPFGRVVRPPGSSVDWCEHPGLRADLVGDSSGFSLVAVGCYGSPEGGIYGRQNIIPDGYDDPARWDGFVVGLDTVPSTSCPDPRDCAQVRATKSTGATVLLSRVVASTLASGTTSDELPSGSTLWRGCSYHAKPPGWWTGQGFTPAPPTADEIDATRASCGDAPRPPACQDDPRPILPGGSGDEPARDCSGDPVNLLTGELSDRAACFAVTGIGPEPLDGGLEYRSGLAARDEAPFGLPPGWSLTYTRRARFVPGDAQDPRPRVRFMLEHGNVRTFYQDADGAFRQVPGNDALGVWRRDPATGGLTFVHRTTPEGEWTERYDARGNLREVRLPQFFVVEVAWSRPEDRTDILVQTLREPKEHPHHGADRGTGREVQRVFQRLPVGPAQGGRLVWRLMSIQESPANRAEGATEPLRATRLSYFTDGDPARWGRLARVLEADGREVSYEYDGTGRMVGRCDAGGVCARTEYVAAGSWKVAKQVLSNGVELAFDATSHRTLENAYDLEVRMSAAGSSETHVRRYLRDPRERGLLRTYAYDSTTSYEANEYDAEGRRISYRDATGAVTRWTRDPRTGDVTAIIDPTGGVTRFVYDGSRRLVRETDPDGRVTEYTWGRGGFGLRPETITRIDDAGRRWTERNPIRERFGRGTRTGMDGAEVEEAYDELGHLAEVVPLDPTPGVRGGPRRLARKVRYDGRGWLVESTGADGVLVRRTYDEVGRLSTVVVDPNGQARVTSFSYDRAGNLASIVRGRTTGVASVTRFEYALVGADRYRPVRIIDPTGVVTELAYDLLGRVVRTREIGVGDGGQDRVYRYEWVRGPNGFSRHTQGPDGVRVRTETWNERGDRLSEIDALGVVTSWEYDASGRIVRVVGPYGPAGAPGVPTIREYEWTPAGKLRSAVVRSGRALGGVPPATLPEPRPSRVDLAWDALGRLSSIRDGEGRVTRVSYDIQGRTVTRTFGAQGPVAEQRTVVETFDVIGRLLRSLRGGAGTRGALVTAYGYEPATSGRDHAANFQDVHEVIDPTGVVRRFRYGSAGELVAVEQDASRPNELSVELTYDELGRVTREQLHTGARLYAYDALDRVTAVTELAGRTGGDSRVRRFVYGPRELRARVDFDGTTTTYGYDSLGRLLTIDENAASAPAVDVTLERLANGLLWRVTDAGGITEYGYDGANRLLSRNRGGLAVSYGYDDLGRLARIFYPGASPSEPLPATLTYGFDAAGELEGMEVATVPASVGARWSVRRNGAGELTDILRSVAAAPVGASRVTYDGAGRVTRIEHRGAVDVSTGRPSAWARDFRSRDDNGRGRAVDTAIVDAARSADYRFDAFGRLTSVRDAVPGMAAIETAFAYDADGNLSRLPDGRRVDVDGWGRISAPGVSYDGRGNLTSDGRARFSYDTQNRLVETTQEGRVVRYGYDGLGHLVWTSDNGVRTDFVLDESRAHASVLASVRTDGRQERFVWGPTGLVGRSTLTPALAPEPARPNVAMFYAAAPPDAAVEGRVTTQLQAAGYEVRTTRVRVGEPLRELPSAATLVIVGPGMPEGVRDAVREQLRGRAVPMIAMDAAIAQALAMSAPGQLGTLAPLVARIVNGTHPLAGGIPESVRFRVTRGQFSIPGPSATVVAVVAGTGPRRPVAYGYARGTTLATGLAAPAARVFLPPPQLGEHDALLQAAIRWVTPPPPPPPAPARISTTWTLTDELGSVVGELDGSGRLVSATRYDAWGTPAPALPGLPFVSTGPAFHGEWRGEDGLVYLRARHYHPGLGRFLQRDGYAGRVTRPSSLNRYAFVENDPLHFIDPSGHSIEDLSNAVAGFGDYWTDPNTYLPLPHEFDGGTAEIRRLLNDGVDPVDRCSPWYKVGRALGEGTSWFLPGPDEVMRGWRWYRRATRWARPFATADDAARIAGGAGDVSRVADETISEVPVIGRRGRPADMSRYPNPLGSRTAQLNRPYDFHTEIQQSYDISPYLNSRDPRLISAGLERQSYLRQELEGHLGSRGLSIDARNYLGGHYQRASDNESRLEDHLRSVRAARGGTQPVAAPPSGPRASDPWVEP